jgi:LmbE family N-acetylglucosaminyl deacetylase
LLRAGPQELGAVVATAVFFHAHPDDEAIATGGTMAKMAADGHRVVLVTATRGELGLTPPDVVGEGESLAVVRERELDLAGKLLGVSRREFLGYRDSGMAGDATNEDPANFWKADVEEAANRLADLLEEEKADVLTIYDEHGGYGHPDHIQVHRVGARAGEIAKTRLVYMATLNRDRVLELMSRAAELGVEGPDLETVDTEAFGEPEARITNAVDVTGFLEPKRSAMRAHASQISETSFFLSMPDDVFALMFGTEWYIRVGAPASGVSGSLLEENPGGS